MSPVKWTEDDFRRRVEERCPDGVAPALEILRWAHDAGIAVRSGTGPDHPSLSLRVDAAGAPRGIPIAWLRDCYPTARLEIPFVTLRKHPAFSGDEVRREFYRRLQVLGVLENSRGSVDGKPTALLTQIADPDRMEKVLEILGDMAGQARG